jgi:hypothetical protein
MAPTRSQYSISLERLDWSRSVGPPTTSHFNLSTEVQDDEGVNNVHASREANEPITQSLRPVDGGYSAWKVLAAAFVFDALLWGEEYTLST